MPLTPGARIGPYEILAPPGAGGMGEVWRAHDARLGRDAAVKALPTPFSQDPERPARFEREAKLPASPNHPGIAGIHGLEESGGQRFLILEFVEGESLEQRLRRGPLPVDDAVDTAIGISRAWEAAHENGVVHRDLKPGNVMVTPTGDVKVLDFGLAKGHDGPDPSSGGLSMSPTLTHLGTDVGVILGTAASMSPEQARGRRVDRRTDIWSFGCVLYECLTGEQVHSGETVSDVVVRILEREPAWDALPARTPPGVRDLLRRCLTKDPSRRLRDIGEARIALENLGAAPPSPAPSPPRPAARRRSRVRGARCVPRRKVPGLRVAGRGQSTSMFRSLENPKPVVLPGTEEARDPFFSPDGERAAFFAGRALRKVSVRGGTPVDPAEVALDRGGTWTEGGISSTAPVTRAASGVSRRGEAFSVRSRWRTRPGGSGPIAGRAPFPAGTGSYSRWGR